MYLRAFGVALLPLLVAIPKIQMLFSFPKRKHRRGFRTVTGRFVGKKKKKAEGIETRRHCRQFTKLRVNGGLVASAAFLLLGRRGGGREAGRKTGRQAAGRPQALHTHRPQPPFTYTHAHMLRVLHYVTKKNNNNLKGEMTLGMSLCYHVVNSLN